MKKKIILRKKDPNAPKPKMILKKKVYPPAPKVNPMRRRNPRNYA